MENKQNKTENGLTFEERDTCYIYSAKQGSEEWHSARYGNITASQISEVCGRSYYGEKKSPHRLALKICGLTKDSFSNNQKLAMEDGVLGEAPVRNWFSEQIINKPINELGIAIWKQDTFMRASLDGETEYINGDPSAVEIKIPTKMNSKLIDIAKSWSLRLNNPHPDSYIYQSHYDQMTMGSVITGKTGCYYVVACIKEKIAFYQYINTDLDLWYNILYPTAKQFHTTYVLPILEERKIQHVSP